VGGTRSRNRTGTRLLSLVFETNASTYSAIRAELANLHIIFKFQAVARCKMQDARCKIQDAGCKMQDMQDDFKKILLGKYITFLKKAD
jgi:hypothetical protein